MLPAYKKCNLHIFCVSASGNSRNTFLGFNLCCLYTNVQSRKKKFVNMHNKKFKFLLFLTETVKKFTLKNVWYCKIKKGISNFVIIYLQHILEVLVHMKSLLKYCTWIV